LEQLGECEAGKETTVTERELAEGRMATDGVGEVIGAWPEVLWTRVGLKRSQGEISSALYLLFVENV